MEQTTFLTRKMKCDGVTLGVSKVLLNALFILHISITWYNDKEKKMPVSEEQANNDR